ncbi:uncharacterized protein [Amphiura filiformis]|uniref:uncharacterized protein n=1 Tax=Amphiura filiformis TaxID=82378 RepID=UPI003B20EA3F
MVINLLDYLRKTLQITDENAILDLADEDGNLQNLPDQHPRRNAARLVQPKITYIPILIERNEDGTPKPYTPMVKRMRKDQDFMKQLQIQYERRERIRRPGRSRQDSVKDRGHLSRQANARKSATALKKGQIRKPTK